MSPTVSAQSVDGLLDHFNLRILNVMEAVAPIHRFTMSCTNKACVVITMSCARPDSCIYLN